MGGRARQSGRPVGAAWGTVPPWTVPKRGPCASSGRPRRLWAARHTRGDRPGHWSVGHWLGCESESPPASPIPLPFGCPGGSRSRSRWRGTLRSVPPCRRRSCASPHSRPCLVSTRLLLSGAPPPSFLSKSRASSTHLICRRSSRVLLFRVRPYTWYTKTTRPLA